MSIKNDSNKKITPNQVAKSYLLDSLTGLYPWAESFPDLNETVTEKERGAIDKAVDRQTNRIIKLLGGYIKHNETGIID